MFRGTKKKPVTNGRQSNETMTWKDKTKGNTRQSELRESLYKSKTSLNAENMYLAVILPGKPQYYVDSPKADKDEINEWMAENTVDFYNELTVMVGVLTEGNDAWEKVCEQSAVDPNFGYPRNITYRWKSQDHGALKTLPVDVYMDHVLIWVNSQIESEDIFPTDEDIDFPGNFKQILSKMFTRMFRIFAIFYSNSCLYGRKVTENHLDLCFRHFLYFGWKWELLDARELKAIDKFTDPLLQKFKRDQDMYFAKTLPLN